MKTILRLWLQEHLNMSVNIDEIAHVVKDGMVFIRLLKCYDAVNVNSIKNVFPSKDDDICRNNLTQLKVWFKLIGIDFTDDIINGIISGNTSICINILYQLFTIFKKNGCNLKTKQTETVSIIDDKKKFKVARSNLPQTHDDGSYVYSYGDRILKCKDMVDFYGQKFLPNVKNKILRCCSSNKTKYNNCRVKKHSTKNSLRTRLSFPLVPGKFISSDSSQFPNQAHGKLSNPISGERLFSTDICSHETNKFIHYDKGDGMLSKNNSLPPVLLQSMFYVPEHVKNYVNELNSSKDFECKRLTRKCCTYVTNDVWKEIINNEKRDLKQAFASRLLKQSMFEKNLGLSLLSILRHNEIQKQQYIEIESRIFNSREPEEHMGGFEEGICDYDINCNYEGSDSRYSSYDECDTGSRYFKRNQSRYKFDDYDNYYENEKQRSIELHRRLYTVKLQLRRQEHHVICYNVLLDIIDLAIHRSEFKLEYRCELPKIIWWFWKILFYHERPVTSILDNLELLMFLDAPEGMDFSEEMINDNILNDAFLEMYIEASEYWELESDESVAEEFAFFMVNRLYSVSHDSQDVLGYIVHRILKTKYPSTPQVIPDITKYPIIAIVDAIDDIEAINNFRNLLMKADILVVEISTAVNYCLQQYKNDSKHFDISHGEENDLQFSDPIKEFSFSEHQAPNKTKFSQTGRNLFEFIDKEELKKVSRLGCEVWNRCLSGTAIPTNIIVDIIIQYIKHHQHKIKGWVLVNYPSSISEASAIELALSSKIFPTPFNNYDKVSANDVENKMKTNFKYTLPGDFFSSFETKLNSSRLVVIPKKFSDEDAFKSIFTLYIKTVKVESVKPGDSEVIIPGRLDGNINETTLLQRPVKVGIPTLHQFYIEQGIAFEFTYESFDMVALKQLASIIILHRMEDSKLLKLRKSSLREDLIRELEPTIEIKFFTPIDLADGKESYLPFNENQFSPQFCEEEQEYDSLSYNDNTSALNKVRESVYSFTNDPILENAALGLANFWETLETVYIVDLQHVLFVMRNLDFSVIPYISSVCKEVEAYLNQEDERQNILTTFLDAYNSIFQELRSDKEMKHELHLRVRELKHRLKSLCLKHRNNCEDLRVNIIKQNWTYQELTFCTNLLLHLVENELRRCLNTLEFLQNYYLSMLGNYSVQSLPSVTVAKLDVYYEESKNESTFSDLVSPTAHRNSEKIDSYYLSTIDRMLNYDTVKNTKNQFLEFLEIETNKAFDEVLMIKSQVDDLISKEEASALKKFGEMNKKKTGISSVKKEKVKYTEDSPEIQFQPDTLPSNDMDKEKYVKIFEEWRSTVKNEIDRLTFRIELLKNKAVQKLSYVEGTMGNNFSELSFMIDDRYLAETICIDNIYELFQTAIEDEIPIKALLIFHKNNYYTIPMPSEIFVPRVKLPAALKEMLSEESFSIEQLKRFKNKLVKVAPSGVIARETFINLIYSMITYSSSQGNIKLVPKIWNKIKFSELQILFQKLFGDNSLIEWRDFLIYCLDLPYPVTEDVIDARMQFLRYDSKEAEFIYFEDFMKTTLWFEREIPENPLRALRNVLSKKFLFSIFKNNRGTMDYMSLIISFCRDENPAVGFCKTLSAVAGRCVIAFKEDFHLGEIFTDNINTEIKIVIRILNDIINDVVDNGMSSDRGKFNLKNVSSPHPSDEPNADSIVSESKYHQIFRRHLVCRWTPIVPKTMIYSIYSMTRFAAMFPRLMVVQGDFYYSAGNFFYNDPDHDIYIPDFLKTWWVIERFCRYRKFMSLSTAPIIKTLIKERRKQFKFSIV